MRSRTGSSNGPGGTASSSSTSGTSVGINVSSSTMERNGGGSGGVGIGGGGGGGGGRSRLHHKRRPGHRRNTQHSVATVEPICDMRKVVNGVVTVDQDKLNKLVQTDPIDLHYAVEEEPFASGLFATVRKCRHRTTGVEYAAKYAAKIRYGQDCTTEILHEIALMSLCTTNPRIIHLIDVFDTPSHMILVMEYAPGGDLQTLMDDDMVPYERDAVKFVRQVLEGLLFLHERSMAHLDIKLQNVLLMGTFPDCDVKLCDLEISRVIVAGQEVRELLGTPDYVSPEILHYEPINLSADIWSVGVMAYVLLTGFTPFGGDTDQETFQNICHGQLDFPDELFEDISPQAEDFIRKTLTREPSCRPTVKECLKHPWLTSWKNVASHQRETISSESQRKNSALHNGPSGAATLACPRSVTSINGHGSSPSTTARSLLRAMSKSREVLYERVAASNLRKSTSKSRERLCEMRLSVSRSRDHLCEEFRSTAAQSRERLHSLRNLSKSHEVLSLLTAEQSPAMPVPDSSGYFDILPATQSLECFTIPTLDKGELPRILPNLGTLSSELTSPAEGITVEEILELNKSLSESTETLCDEGEKTTTADFVDEITPSNSRSETPTQELSLTTQKTEADVAVSDAPASCNETTTNATCDPIQPQEGVKHEPVLSRADAVASSLKRLSSNGPPVPKLQSLTEALSPSLGKSPWNWPTSNANTADGNTSSAASKSPVSPNIIAGYSARKSFAFPSSFSLKDQPTSTSPLSTDESTTAALGSDTASALLSPPNSSPAAVKPTESPTPARMSVTSIDTASLSDSQRQLLTSCLNRRRASWACGSRQEDVSSIISPSNTSKQPEIKLSVSELITSFNQCQLPGVAVNITAKTISETAVPRPNSVKKLSEGFIHHQDSATPSSGSASTGKLEKKKTVFKPVSTSIQVFERSLVAGVAGGPTSSPLAPVTQGIQRNAEVTMRPRSHHLSWDIRALPRLPEDAICSPRNEEPTPLGTPEGGTTKSAEDKTVEEQKEKTITAPEVEEDYGLRSGSVSSDTGCSSSSDLSDRSSDEGLEATREPRRKKTTGGRDCGNGPEPESDLIEGALTSPPGSWTGRPRSFSVQSEISLLAQPWNRVCVGSVARAFEKFGTKVDGDNAGSNPPSTGSTYRSRRQSTPGPFK